jgi:pimeloyl-ACP methyl ester carboxylesterase
VIGAVVAASICALAGGAVAVLAHRAIRRRSLARALVISNSDGIDESSFVRAGGIEQWISIRGRHRENPAILVIHGGPGCSYSIFTPLLSAWEEHFTVVQWDQRGCGKTLRRNGPDACGEIGLDVLVSDAVEIAEHVRHELGVEKLVLLASSMGTLVGIGLVKRRPDLFSAYVGTDQNVAMGRDDELHEVAVDRLRRAGRTKEARALERLGPDPTRWSARDWAKSGEWITRSDPEQNKAIMRLLLRSLWFSPLHRLDEIRRFGAGMALTTERWFPEFLSFDARRLGLEFPVPFFLFQGANDIHTPTARAVAYYRSISAPIKAMELIEGTGHFTAFLRPDAFLDALLTHVRPVASRRVSGSAEIA